MLTDAGFTDAQFHGWTGYRTSSFTQGGLVTARKALVDACIRSGRASAQDACVRSANHLMNATPDARAFFTERHALYSRFICAMRYPQGLRAFFLGSPLVRPGLRILDAGCGTGALTLAVRDAFVRRGCVPSALHAFDLTPAMLDQLREALHRRGINDVELAEANVLQLDGLPASWRDYHLIVSAAMLEYVPRDRFVDALAGLRGRLQEGGRLVLFITRRNPLTRLLIGRWWASNLYTAGELSDACERAGFSRFAFRKFPTAARYLSVWGYIVEATR